MFGFRITGARTHSATRWSSVLNSIQGVPLLRAPLDGEGSLCGSPNRGAPSPSRGALCGVCAQLDGPHRQKRVVSHVPSPAPPLCLPGPASPPCTATPPQAAPKPA